MRILVALAAVVLSSVTVGCGTHHVNVGEGHLFLPKDWQAEQVKITCPSGDCPAGVGLFLLLRDEENGFEASRCTATLISPDRVLTNEHCNLPESQRGYFILPLDGRLIIRHLSHSLFSARDRMSGVGRDVAIWQLDRPINEVRPLKVSRQIPDRLSDMVAYVMNTNAPEADDLSAFKLEKRVCHTHPHVPVLGVGVDDRAIGLALYDCEIRKGNSGAPVFASDDRQTVQVLINTVWNGTQGEDHSLNESLSYWFLDKVPSSLDAVFAMGERVHCLPLLDFQAPLVACGPNQEIRRNLMNARRELVTKWYAQEPQQGVLWGARLVDLFMKNGDGSPKLALAVVPVPLCKKNDRPTQATVDIRYYQLGLNSEDAMAARPSGNGKYESGSIQLDSRFRFARGQKEKWGELLEQPLKIPPCDIDSFAKDGRAALEDVERFPMFNSSLN